MVSSHIVDYLDNQRYNPGLLENNHLLLTLSGRQGDNCQPFVDALGDYMYKIELTRSARKAYIKLPTKLRLSIYEKLQRLAMSPFDSTQDIKKLQGVEECYRLRHGDYRILYRIDNQVLVIEVIKIAHRKEVYQ